MNYKKAYVIVEGSVPSYKINYQRATAKLAPANPHHDYSAKIFSKIFINRDKAMLECASLKLKSSCTDFYVQEVIIDYNHCTAALELSAYVNDLVHLRTADIKPDSGEINPGDIYIKP
jgi:hypothetical protein